MNKKRILYAILSVILVPAIFFGLSIFRDFLSERAVEPEVAKNDGPPSVRLDGKLYQAGIEFDELDEEWNMFTSSLPGGYTYSNWICHMY